MGKIEGEDNVEFRISKRKLDHSHSGLSSSKAHISNSYMFVYSLTVSIVEPEAMNWMIWMRTEHLPAIMETGCFDEVSIKELVEPKPEQGMSTYNFQFKARTKEHIQDYMQTHAQRIHSKHDEKYKGRYMAFDTILKEIL